MTIALPTITPTNVVLLRVLDALLSLHGDAGPGRDRLEVDLDILSLRLHVRMCGDTVSEAQIDLPDEGASVLPALRWHLGPDLELATMHRRINRWLVGGREVILDSFNGHRTCLRVA
jgi:hypothetical protein